MKRANGSGRIFFIVVLFGGLFGCGEGTIESASMVSDNNPFVYPDNNQSARVLLMDQQIGVDLLVDLEAILVSYPKAEFVMQVLPGDFLVSVQNESFLRRVKDFPSQDGEWVRIPTQKAELTDLLPDMEAELTKPFAVTTFWPGSRGSTTWKPNGVHFSYEDINIIDVAAADENAMKIDLNHARFDFDPELEFNLRIKRGRLEHLLASLAGRMDVGFEVSLDVRGRWAQPFELFAVQKPLIKFEQMFVFWLGPIPVAVTVAEHIGLGLEFEVEGELQAVLGSSLSAQVTAGGQYSGGAWNAIQGLEFDASFDRFEVSGSGSLKSIRVYPMAMIIFKLYDSVGPSISLEPYLQKGTSIEDPDFRTGIRGQFRVAWDVPILDKTMMVWRKPLFDCYLRNLSRQTECELLGD